MPLDVLRKVFGRPQPVVTFQKGRAVHEWIQRVHPRPVALDKMVSHLALRQNGVPDAVEQSIILAVRAVSGGADVAVCSRRREVVFVAGRGMIKYDESFEESLACSEESLACSGSAVSKTRSTTAAVPMERAPPLSMPTSFNLIILNRRYPPNTWPFLLGFQEGDQLWTSIMKSLIGRQKLRPLANWMIILGCKPLDVFSS